MDKAVYSSLKDFFDRIKAEGEIAAVYTRETKEGHPTGDNKVENILNDCVILGDSKDDLVIWIPYHTILKVETALIGCEGIASGQGGYSSLKDFFDRIEREGRYVHVSAGAGSFSYGKVENTLDDCVILSRDETVAWIPYRAILSVKMDEKILG